MELFLVTRNEQHEKDYLGNRHCRYRHVRAGR
jgi:hypothetical protein